MSESSTFRPARVDRPEPSLSPSSRTETRLNRPTLLYVGQNPAAGTGSPIIVLRHLRRFAADGWNVVILGEYGGDYRECEAAGWRINHLCLRRWWWPPYRDRYPILRWIRLRLLAREAIAGLPNPDFVFGYLAAHADFSADLAGHVARVSGAPLHMLAHDDAAAFPYAKGREAALRRSHDRILRRAKVCWFVSPELAECYPSTVSKQRVLYPIPEGWSTPAVWRDELRTHSPVYYAGHLWPEQLPLMARIARAAAEAGAELVVMAQQTEVLREFCLSEPARWHPQFPTNREALDHLVSQAAGVLVSYADTIADMPWCATSFPSKLVEYCHLGVPVAVVAQPDSAVARWAARVNFPHLFRPTELGPLKDWFAGLKQRHLWEERAAISLYFARTEFDPARIQAELANTMLAGTEPAKS
jgi:hypothetical protein